MKRVLLLTVVMVFVSSLAFAQAGSLLMAADPLGTNCNLQDIVPQVTVYYVVHVNTPGATASQFSAPQPACNLAVFLADQQFFAVTIGSSQTGVAVGYGVCLGSPITVLGLQFFTQGLTPPCCYYPVLPDPAAPSGQIEVVDCVSQLQLATGGVGIINSLPTCNCTIPTQDSTWGGIKSLYAD